MLTGTGRKNTRLPGFIYPVVKYEDLTPNGVVLVSLPIQLRGTDIQIRYEDVTQPSIRQTRRVETA